MQSVNITSKVVV